MLNILPAWAQALVLLVTAAIGSSGMWAYLQRKDVTKKATLRLLLGLAHDRIIFLGMQYKERGWITKDEYEDYIHYLCEPYEQFGGNGLAEKVMADVKGLPMYTKPQTTRMSFPTTEKEKTDGSERN